MKKWVIVILIVCTWINSSKAQFPFDIPLMTENWELIADRTYVKTKDGKYIPTYPAGLKALNNKSIELPGYLIPFKAGRLHDTFMLSVVPLNQCDFCGADGIPDMVEVHLAKGETPLPYASKPITIRGRLVLNMTDNYYIPLFTLAEAKLVNSD